MAEMIAKGLVGDTMGSVSGAFGSDEKKDAGEDDIAEARLLEEAKRKDKHKKMEEEREVMRHQIRDKYNLKKKDAAADSANKYARKGPKQTPSQNSEDNCETDPDPPSAPSKQGAPESSSSKGGKCLLQ